MKIAITGNIGSGKSTVAKVFGAMGFDILDADALAKSLYEIPTIRIQVEELLKTSIISPSGGIDYAKIASVYFNDIDIYNSLNKILYPALKKLIEEVISNCQNSNVALEAAILFEAGLEKDFDKIIVVSAPRKMRFRKVNSRNGMTQEQFLERENRQFSQEWKEQHCSTVVVNDESSSVIEQVEKIILDN
jgi:dephospho-CoA kinase